MFPIYDSYVNTTKPTTPSLTFEIEPDNKASVKGDFQRTWKSRLNTLSGISFIPAGKD